jgi:hypothetical protein
MPPPPNETAATAAAMTVLPYSTTLDVSEATSPNYDVWWSYTAEDGDTVIGFWAFSEVGGLYAPVTTVWTGPDASTLTQVLNISAANKPLQVPVTAGETYWFRVRQSDSGVEPDIVLTVSALRGSDVLASAGSILINDDTTGFPAVLVDASTGEPLQFLNGFPAGEGGDTLAGGEILVNDFATNTYQLWVKDPVTGILTYDSSPIVGTAEDVIRANRTLDAFYVTQTGANTPVQRVNGDGSLGASWTLTGYPAVFGMAINNDETIAYFSTMSTGSPVHRWNMTTDTTMADFVAGVANYYVRDILALSDGTILFSRVQTVLGEITVYRYSEAGALLNTYGPYDSNIPSGTQPRIGYHNVNDASFWVWTHGESADEGLSTFRRIQVSDGTVLETIVTTEYETGVYNRVETETPSSRFGVSFSCPFLITTVDYEPPGGGGPPTPPEPPSPDGYTTATRTPRRMRIAPHLHQGNQRLVYNRLTLDMETGVGLSSGQGEDPQVMLQLSNDGGHTYGNEIWQTFGRQGEYRTQVTFRRLGMARDRVFKLVISDPVRVRIVGGDLDVEAGTD